MSDLIILLLRGGWNELLEYLSAHVLGCLIPAFFIAGAMAVLLSQGAVLKYFGAAAKKHISYAVASVSGMLLAVCSCTILPLFAGIYNLGAGLGPAITFLYSGPAINILAISLTGAAIGWHMGAARAVGAVVFSIVIGLTMAFFFRKEEKARQSEDFALLEEDPGKPIKFIIPFFTVLVAILIISTSTLTLWIKLLLDGLLLGLVAFMVHFYFEEGEFKEWLQETWGLAKLVVPTLIIGVFVVGMITSVLPPQWIARFVGENTLQANFVASLVGALFYFSTLTEVPIVRGLMNLGMDSGPALALLLAGPAVSIPNLFVVGRVLGVGKTIIYFILVVIMATFTGWIYGAFFV